MEKKAIIPVKFNLWTPLQLGDALVTKEQSIK